MERWETMSVGVEHLLLLITQGLALWYVAHSSVIQHTAQGSPAPTGCVHQGWVGCRSAVCGPQWPPASGASGTYRTWRNGNRCLRDRHAPPKAPSDAPPIARLFIGTKVTCPPSLGPAVVSGWMPWTTRYHYLYCHHSQYHSIGITTTMNLFGGGMSMINIYGSPISHPIFFTWHPKYSPYSWKIYIYIFYIWDIYNYGYLP